VFTKELPVVYIFYVSGTRNNFLGGNNDYQVFFLLENGNCQAIVLQNSF